MNESILYKYNTKQLAKKGLIDYKYFRPGSLALYRGIIVEVLKIEKTHILTYQADLMISQRVTKFELEPLTSEYLKKKREELISTTIKRSILNSSEKRSDYIYKLLDKIVGKYYPKERYELDNGYNRVNLIIHYPELTLSNSAGQTHLLKDMYCKFVFGTGMFPIRLDKIYFARTTATKDDFWIYSGDISIYTHSHLPKRSFGTFHDGFCFGGDTAIGQKVHEYSKKFDIRTFSTFLINFENVLQWESLEGGPYTRLSDLKSGALLPASTPKLLFNTIHDLYLRTLRELKRLNKFPSFGFDGNSIEIPYKRKLHQIITKVIDEDPSYDIPKYKFDEEAMMSFTNTDSRIVAKMKSIDGKPSGVKFKGETIPIKVIFGQENEAEENIEEKLVHYDVYKQVVDKMTIELEQLLLINLEEDAEE